MYIRTALYVHKHSILRIIEKDDLVDNNPNCNESFTYFISIFQALNYLFSLLSFCLHIWPKFLIVTGGRMELTGGGGGGGNLPNIIFPESNILWLYLVRSADLLGFWQAQFKVSPRTLLTTHTSYPVPPPSTLLLTHPSYPVPPPSTLPTTHTSFPVPPPYPFDQPTQMSVIVTTLVSAYLASSLRHNLIPSWTLSWQACSDLLAQ